MGKEDNLKFMEGYLKHAMEFEKYVYIWSNAMNKANSQMKKIYSDRNSIQQNKNVALSRLSTIEAEYSEKQAEIDKKADLFDVRAKKAKKSSKVAFVLLVLIVAAGILGIIFSSKAQLDAGIETELAIFRSVYLGGILTIMAAIAPLIIFIVNKGRSGRAARRNEKLSNTDVTDTKLKDKAELEDNISYYSNMLQKSLWTEKNVSAQQEEIQTNLNIAKKNLAEIYSLNVLPGKYRTFESVATLYGYIVGFRCTIVKGSGGIYDTYEKDLQASVIIEKLSNIEASLSRIEYYQRELVNQARIANNQLASINSSLESINNYSAEIAKNSQITAVASQQSAAALQWQNFHMWSNGY